MVLKSIYIFDNNDWGDRGRAAGAIINNRYRIPVLKTLYEIGANDFHSNGEIHDYLKDKINLRDPDLIKSKSNVEWEYRIKWSLNQLKNAGLVVKDPDKRTSWKLTDFGKEFLQDFGLIDSIEIEENKIEEARNKVDLLVAERKPKTEIHYWAAGFGSSGNSDEDHKKLSDFIENQYWQALDYGDNDTSKTAKKARDIFAKIKIGDKFLIKGFGGKSDLKVYFVGTVVNIDEDVYRVDLEKEDVPLYSDKAPSGSGAGNWFNTLLEVTRKVDIDLLFNGKLKNKKVENNEVSEPIKTTLNMEKNIILYGPPGTGKTHKMQELITKYGLLIPAKTGDKDYDNFVRDYTWWELVAMALLDMSGNEAKVPELMKHPLILAKYAQSEIQNLRARLWSTLQHHTVESCPNVKLKKRHGEPVFFKEANSNWRLDDLASFKLNFDILVEELNELNNSAIKKEQKNYLFTTCHQSLSYEDFIEGIKPILSSDSINSDQSDLDVKYEIRKGYFYQACNKAEQIAGFANLKDCLESSKEERKAKFEKANNENKVFYIFLDEINRCNVAAVFGELITLIEDNKRLGCINEIADTILPYSQKAFGVPSNLYIVGTMNTADRSVEALDTALRRRFSFEEIKADSTLLKSKTVNGISMQTLLYTINQRISYLLDDDHQIGHSYFFDIGVNDVDALKLVFKNKIIPLLKEYFYNDYEKIHLILGDSFIKEEKSAPSFASKRKSDMGKQTYRFIELNDTFDIIAALKSTLDE